MDSRIEKLQKITADGRHNAFPGLTRFKGALYLSYRSSTGHAMNDGKIVLKRSFDNGENWEDCPCTMNHKNCYDGFTVVYKGKLFMYSSVYPADIEHPVWMHAPRACVSVSENGTDWSSPKEITPYFAMCFWHPVVINDLLYVAAYRIYRSFQGSRMEVDLLCSSDGFDWKFVSRISELPGGNETALLFDGETLHAFIRNESGTLQIKKSSGNFTVWSEAKDFGVSLQGPVASCINGRIFLSGRFREASPRLFSSFSNRAETLFRTYVYVPEIDSFVEYADYPSGFDCAYSESVKLDDLRMLTVYYSQHEYGDQENFRDMESGSDIFLATVRTDMSPAWGKLTPRAKDFLNNMKEDNK